MGAFGPWPALGLVSQSLLFPGCASSGFGPAQPPPEESQLWGQRARHLTGDAPGFPEPRRSQAVLPCGLGQVPLRPPLPRGVPPPTCPGLSQVVRQHTDGVLPLPAPVHGVRRPRPLSRFGRGDSGWGVRGRWSCRGRTGCQQRGSPSGLPGLCLPRAASVLRVAAVSRSQAASPDTEPVLSPGPGLVRKGCR